MDIVVTRYTSLKSVRAEEELVLSAVGVGAVLLEPKYLVNGVEVGEEVRALYVFCRDASVEDGTALADGLNLFGFGVAGTLDVVGLLVLGLDEDDGDGLRTGIGEVGTLLAVAKHEIVQNASNSVSATPAALVCSLPFIRLVRLFFPLQLTEPRCCRHDKSIASFGLPIMAL